MKHLDSLINAIIRGLYRSNLDESILIVLFAALVLTLIGGSMHIGFVLMKLAV